MRNVGGRKKFARSVSYLLVVVFSLFSFFCNHAFIVSRYKRPHAALAMEKTKPKNANLPPASTLDSKNQTPRVYRNSLPRLAPKIINPRQVRKQYIDTYR